MKYSEKLKDPRWQKKRLEIFERDGWECKSCEKKSNTLHVHHKVYHPTKVPWDIPSENLITLCEDCHKNEPAARDEATKRLLAVLYRHYISWGIDDLADIFASIPSEHASNVIHELYTRYENRDWTKDPIKFG